MRKLWILFPLLLLAACGDKHLEIALPPADKLACPEEPGRPGTPGEAVTDEQAAAYMVQLRAAGQGCRDDVDWLRDWFAALKARK